MALMSLVRKHVERLHTDICDIWEYTQTVDGSGITCFDELQVQQQLPCRLNYYTSTSTGEGKAASVSQNATAYAASLGIRHNGNFYTIEVTNPVEYAPYVEFGHCQTPGRFVPALGKQLKAAWVNGQFMLTISANEIQSIMPAFLEQRLNALLREAFHD